MNTVTPTAVTSFCSMQCSDVICIAGRDTTAGLRVKYAINIISLFLLELCCEKQQQTDTDLAAVALSQDTQNCLEEG